MRRRNLLLVTLLLCSSSLCVLAQLPPDAVTQPETTTQPAATHTTATHPTDTHPTDTHTTATHSTTDTHVDIKPAADVKADAAATAADAQNAVSGKQLDAAIQEAADAQQFLQPADQKVVSNEIKQAPPAALANADGDIATTGGCICVVDGCTSMGCCGGCCVYNTGIMYMQCGCVSSRACWGVR